MSKFLWEILIIIPMREGYLQNKETNKSNTRDPSVAKFPWMFEDVPIRRFIAAVEAGEF